MKIKVINPNTYLAMTKSIDIIAKKCARSGTEIVCVSPERGPITIEDNYDEALATIGAIEEVKKGMQENFDGYVIACFRDAGLYACRELTETPVIGMAEASFFIACMLGHKFSIISILNRFKSSMEELLRKYGLDSRCASIRCTNVPVADFERDRAKGEAALIEAGQKAIEQDRAEVLCLGCAGMVGFDQVMERMLHVPVIDPVVAAVKMAEAVIETGKKTSKIMTFQPPEKKEIVGYPGIFQL